MQVGSVPADDLQLGQVLGGAKAGRQDDDVEVMALALFVEQTAGVQPRNGGGERDMLLAQRLVVGVASDGALGAERMVRRQLLDEIGASGERLRQMRRRNARAGTGWFWIAPRPAGRKSSVSRI